MLRLIFVSLLLAGCPVESRRSVDPVEMEAGLRARVQLTSLRDCLAEVPPSVMVRTAEMGPATPEETAVRLAAALDRLEAIEACVAELGPVNATPTRELLTESLELSSPDDKGGLFVNQKISKLEAKISRLEEGLADLEQKVGNEAGPPAKALAYSELKVWTNRGVGILLEGRAIEPRESVPIRSARGLLQIGKGTSAADDPFQVKLRYRLDGDRITLAVDATPWAVVRDKEGLGLGRTPVTAIRGHAKTKLELTSPKRESLVIELNFF